MPRYERNGSRKPRELANRRVPQLGYYFIVTDTKETEQNYMYGLRASIPKELQGKLVIKVIKTKSNNLVNEAINLASVNPQYGEILPQIEVVIQFVVCIFQLSESNLFYMIGGNRLWHNAQHQ